MRRLKRWWSDKGLLLFAQGLIGALRGFFRVQEALAPPEKQAKLRRLREQMDHVERQKQDILETLKDSASDSPLRMLEKLERFEKEHGTPESVASTRGHIEWIRALDDESAVLMRLRDETEGDASKQVAAMREYCAEHPESEMGVAYLIGALQNAKQFDEAIQVAEHQINHFERTQPSEIKAVRVFSARHRIGTLLLEKGDAQDAILHLETLIAEQKQNDNTHLSLAYLTLGDAYRKREAMPEAKKAWKDALRYDEYGVIKMEVAKRMQEIT